MHYSTKITASWNVKNMFETSLYHVKHNVPQHPLIVVYHSVINPQYWNFNSVIASTDQMYKIARSVTYSCFSYSKFRYL